MQIVLLICIIKTLLFLTENNMITTLSDNNLWIIVCLIHVVCEHERRQLVIS